ncbi:hypothetical protein F5X68DRAFT_217129, partial [Plectosphaerella plurivora]
MGPPSEAGAGTDGPDISRQLSVRWALPCLRWSPFVPSSVSPAHLRLVQTLAAVDRTTRTGHDTTRPSPVGRRPSAVCLLGHSVQCSVGRQHSHRRSPRQDMTDGCRHDITSNAHSRIRPVSGRRGRRSGCPSSSIPHNRIACPRGRILQTTARRATWWVGCVGSSRVPHPRQDARARSSRRSGSSRTRYMYRYRPAQDSQLSRLPLPVHHHPTVPGTKCSHVADQQRPPGMWPAALPYRGDTPGTTPKGEAVVIRTSTRGACPCGRLL